MTLEIVLIFETNVSKNWFYTSVKDFMFGLFYTEFYSFNCSIVLGNDISYVAEAADNFDRFSV